MQGKKGYGYIPKRKKIIIEHYCRNCGILYCRRLAKAYNFEPKLLKFYNFYCPKCAESEDDINPIFQSFNIPIKIREF